MSAHNPAFPPQHDPATHEFGLTQRQYFIGQALAGFCANSAVFGYNHSFGWGLVNCTNEQLAEVCAAVADAVLGLPDAAQVANKPAVTPAAQKGGD